MKKLTRVIGAMAFVLPFAASATTSIMFDADGAGGAYSSQSIDTLQWQVGNALSVGGGNLSNGTVTQLLYQANLSTTSLDGETQTVSCISSANCLTAVAGFQESAILSNGGKTATFSLVSPNVQSSTNYFYIYSKPGTQGNNLAGTGFSTGTRILTGHIGSIVSSSYTATDTIELFDQKGGDDYSGKRTVVGGGLTNVNVVIDSADGNFFPGLAMDSLIFSFFNTGTLTPFTGVNPSRQFSSNGIANGDVTPVLGLINGFAAAGANDFQFQAAASQSFLPSTNVPEPSTIFLTGLALAALGVTSRRRNR